MKYKVGDEVLVKAKITGYLSGCALVRFMGVNKEEYDFCPDPSSIYESPMTTEEAWELVKKLFSGYKDSEMNEIFGKCWSYPKLMELTPQQAKAKIEAWEAKKEIKLGDEVEFDDTTNDIHRSMLVTSKIGETDYCGICKNGDAYCVHKSALKKTGRHINIDEILKQIGGDK